MNEHPEKKKKALKANLERNKERLLINLKDRSDILNALDFTLSKCNDKNYGAKITVKDIFIHLINGLKEADIPKIQQASIKTDEDLLKFEWTKDQEKAKQQIDFNTWLLKKLKLKSINTGKTTESSPIA